MGDNFYNLDATGQSVFKSAVVGQKLTFFIKIRTTGPTHYEDADPDIVDAFLFTNDTDPDGDPLLINYIDDLSPWYGTGFSFSSEGTFTFFLDNNNLVVDALNDNETLTQLFQYGATEGNGGNTNIATLTITIHGHTDP